jgi:hypothetical protein
MRRARQIRKDVIETLFPAAMSVPLTELPKPTQISSEEAKEIGDKLGIDWDEIDLEEFRKGLMVEFEHGAQPGQQTDITGNDFYMTGKIAWVHLKELPDYYTRLKKMQGEGS